MNFQSISAKVTAALVVVFVAVGLGGAILVWGIQTLASDARLAMQTQNALGAAQTASKALSDAHVGVLMVVNNGYTIDEARLDERFAQLDSSIDKLRALFRDDASAEQAAHVDSLVGLITKWRNEVVEQQLRDSLSINSVDIARVREASPLNQEIWRELGSVFANLYNNTRDALQKANEHQLQLIDIMRVMLIGGVAVLMLFLVATAVLTRKGVVGPLSHLAEATGRLRNRDWDTPVPHAGRNDEIGTLAKALDLFRDAGRRADEADERQRKENEIALKRARALEAATHSFQSQSKSALGDLDGAAHRMGGAANALHDAAAATLQVAEEVSGAAVSTEHSVQSVASAIEEMTVSISDISRQLDDVSNLTRQTSNASSDARKRVDALQTRSKSINEVVTLISGIANEINLLALNATIEAARAGQSGAGFAVVAHEVKSLADQTAKATGEISEVISKVGDDVQGVVTAMSTIDDSITNVDGSTAAVSAAVHEQSVALEEISRNVSEVANQTSRVAGSVRASETRAAETETLSKDLSNVSTTVNQAGQNLGSTIATFIAAVTSDATTADNDPGRRRAA